MVKVTQALKAMLEVRALLVTQVHKADKVTLDRKVVLETLVLQARLDRLERLEFKAGQVTLEPVETQGLRGRRETLGLRDLSETLELLGLLGLREGKGTQAHKAM